jgi:hypothetical protein
MWVVAISLEDAKHMDWIGAILMRYEILYYLVVVSLHVLPFAYDSASHVD